MQKCKGDWQGDHAGKSEAGNTGNGCSRKTCNFCGVKGHKEAQCFKKNPKKASGLWKAKHAKAESASPSIEVTLTLMGNVGKTGVDVMALQAEKGNAMAVLRYENVWICDTGPSMHVTWSSKCTRNV